MGSLGLGSAVPGKQVGAWGEDLGRRTKQFHQAAAMETRGSSIQVFHPQILPPTKANGEGS